MKGFIFIFFALCIDGLQAGLSWALIAAGGAMQAATPAGGGVGGAVAGAAVCWNLSTGGVIGGVIDAAKCALAGGAIGAVVGAAGIPIGIAFGFVVNICISLTFGVMFVGLLFLCDVADFWNLGDWRIIGGGGLLEVIPGLDMFPGWTAMTITLVIKSKARRGLLSTSPTKAFGALLGIGTAAGTAATAIYATNESSVARARSGGVFTKEQQGARLRGGKGRVAQNLRNIQNFDGVREPISKNDAYATV